MVLSTRRVDSQNHRARREFVEPVLKFSYQNRNDLVVKNALVISLKRSFDTRLKEFNEKNQFDGTMEVIEAVDGNELPEIEEGIPLHKGDMGCLLSHLKALQYAKEKKWDCVMIFEDDARFVPDFNNKLKAAMRELPENWDMLWIGGNNVKMPYPYSRNLKRLVSSWGTYGYVIRDTVYDFFIKLFDERKLSSDDYYRRHHARFYSFRTSESLVTHQQRSSDRITTNVLAKRGTIP